MNVADRRADEAEMALSALLNARLASVSAGRSPTVCGRLAIGSPFGTKDTDSGRMNMLAALHLEVRRAFSTVETTF
jgi:hypothetical protein